MKKEFYGWLILLIIGMSSCLDTSNDIDTWDGGVTYLFAAQDGSSLIPGWSDGAAYYKNEDGLEYDFGHERIDEVGGMQLLSNNTTADSIFHYAQRTLSRNDVSGPGLAPNTKYDFYVQISWIAMLPDAPDLGYDDVNDWKSAIKLAISDERVAVSENEAGVMIPNINPGSFVGAGDDNVVHGKMVIPGTDGQNNNPENKKYFSQTGATQIQSTTDALGAVNLMVGYLSNVKVKFGMHVTSIAINYKKAN
ncbi:hypothetical protein FUAX_19940 [Fulvitalea axinellae]|uniref:Uncharacterized protein n=1 Tax=Fulvitalea axinellae TaxID=1182444 RepID=A0AAU9CVW5_9BACT|nr:hypothetical protein FUAX_19940 [Fulvitalea axinellae]